MMGDAAIAAVLAAPLALGLALGAWARRLLGRR